MGFNLMYGMRIGHLLTFRLDGGQEVRLVRLQGVIRYATGKPIQPPRQRKRNRERPEEFGELRNPLHRG